jgi:hypothetical protein
MPKLSKERATKKRPAKKQVPQQEGVTNKVLQNTKQLIKTTLKQWGTVKLKLNGEERECVSAATLSAMAGLKTGTLRKYEQRKKFPPANIRKKANRSLGTGDRYYLVDTAKKSALLLRLFFVNGKKTDPEVIRQLFQLFKDERAVITENTKDNATD